MNIKKELIKTWKSLLGLQFGKVWTDAELKISDKVVGGKVETIQADGSLAPAEDGEYVMDNGFAFTVKGGVIESIVGEEPAEEVVAEETDEELAKQQANKTKNNTSDEVYSNTSKTSIKAYTQPMTNQESDWLSELVNSKSVWFESPLGLMVPIQLVNSNYQIQKKKYSKEFIQYQFEFILNDNYLSMLINNSFIINQA